MTRSVWVWTGAALLGAACLAAGHAWGGAPAGDLVAPSAVALQRTRRLPSDLEIGGLLAGVPRGQTRFVSLAQLQSLPQETYTVTDDLNFGRTVRITGIALEKLPGLLSAAGVRSQDAASGTVMVTALCSDAYAAHYPASYLRAHHPLLVIALEGKPPTQWPAGEGGESMGPYLVSHPSFQPAFRVLSHQDEAQVPWGVVRLDFEDEQQVYAPIEPTGPGAKNPLVQQGFQIARQNCFRCHGRNGEGGEKSNRPWDVVARRAAADPQYFDTYVRNPKSLNPASRMAASPAYDDATLRALRAYFDQFAGSTS